MQIMTTQEAFEGTPLEVVSFGGERWVRGPHIAAALGFADPADAAKKMYQRNQSEFDEACCIAVELPSPAGKRLVRLYNARGAALFAMKAQTPKGEAFRRWVLDVLEGKAGIGADVSDGLPAAAAEGVQATVINALREMFLSQRHSPAVVRYRSMGLNAAEIRKLLSVSASTVHKKLRVAEYLGLVEVDPRTLAFRQSPVFLQMINRKRETEARRKAKLTAAQLPAPDVSGAGTSESAEVNHG